MTNGRRRYRKKQQAGTHIRLFHKTIGIQAGETLQTTDSNRVLEDYGGISFTGPDYRISSKGSNILKVRAGSDCSKGICNHECAGTCSGRGTRTPKKVQPVQTIYKSDRSQDMAVYGNVETVPARAVVFRDIKRPDLSIKNSVRTAMLKI